MFHSIYRGVNIYRKTTPGHQLPWTAMVPNGYVAADTLAEVKEAIREALTKGVK